MRARARDKTLANVDRKKSCREATADRPASRSPHGPAAENVYYYTYILSGCRRVAIGFKGKIFVVCGEGGALGSAGIATDEDPW